MAERKTAPAQTLRVVIYDPEGNPVAVRPVDARELIASGYTGELPEPDKVTKPEPVVVSPAGEPLPAQAAKVSAIKPTSSKGSASKGK